FLADTDSFPNGGSRIAQRSHADVPIPILEPEFGHPFGIDSANDGLPGVETPGYLTMPRKSGAGEPFNLPSVCRARAPIRGSQRQSRPRRTWQFGASSRSDSGARSPCQACFGTNQLLHKRGSKVPSRQEALQLAAPYSSASSTS